MIQSNSDYDIMSSAEVANIVSHFTPEMIEDTIQQAIINNKVFAYGQMKPNLVQGINAMYNNTDIDGISSDIKLARESAFNIIIESLCKNFNMSLSPVVDQSTDRFTLANIMYDFFIYKFDKYIIEFLSAYIVKEASTYAGILNSMSDMKENSTYAKKMFKDQYADLGVVYTNTSWVLTQVLVADIAFTDMVYMAFGPQYKVFADMLCSNVVDCGDFFKMICVPIIRDNWAFVITNIKLSLQQRTGHAIAEFV